MALWHVALSAAVGGIGFSAWSALHPASEVFGPTLRRTGCSRNLALTFDDGPNPKVTPRVLDLLDRYHAQATFFLIGQHVRLFPQLAAEIAGRGHAIGNHTDTHCGLLWLSRQRIRAELICCQQSIERATGRRPLWMRPPYGFRGPQLDAVAHEVGFAAVVMWSLTGRDWNPQPGATMCRRLGKARGGDIILLHDGDHRVVDADRSHTIAALESWLPQWNNAGLQLVTLDAICR
ncbi:MAG: polysaccharide deacetylase family protein [Acidobacteria bacterium]|nr:polysaccharide deacetylase family protein [Acidobacteriota bacterium]